MSDRELEKLIGDDNTKGVCEMGGVMSILVTRSVHLVNNGKITPDEGLQVFRWCVQKEAEFKSNTSPSQWQYIVEHGMSGQELSEWGEDGYKNLVNSWAEHLDLKSVY